MFNAFLKYERDFREWVEADFPNINPLSRDFLEHLREPRLVSSVIKYRKEPANANQ